ncbi:MAG: hypothetical protein PF569_02470 [Candidatus Woesearchaeota archaeon]|jgi:hypothetical protein|nr:hypothetical protein [Candidatus Woesearchaeota archaeon]
METNNLTYEEKKNLYTKTFSIGNFHKTSSIDEKMVLLSLVSLVYLKTKEKKRDIIPLDILIQITQGTKDDSAFYNMLESLSILVEDFCYETEVASSCGLKNSKEIIHKIKEILNSWIPF